MISIRASVIPPEINIENDNEEFGELINEITNKSG